MQNFGYQSVFIICSHVINYIEQVAFATAINLTYIRIHIPLSAMWNWSSNIVLMWARREVRRGVASEYPDICGGVFGCHIVYGGIIIQYLFPYNLYLKNALCIIYIYVDWLSNPMYIYIYISIYIYGYINQLLSDIKFEDSIYNGCTSTDAFSSSMFISEELESKTLIFSG